MNFREEYKEAFSEIHASEALKQKILEAKNDMKGKNIRLGKKKKTFMALLAAAIIVSACGAAASADSLTDGTLPVSAGGTVSETELGTECNTDGETEELPDDDASEEVNGDAAYRTHRRGSKDSDELSSASGGFTIRVYVNKQEVNAADYVDSGKIKVTETEKEIQFAARDIGSITYAGKEFKEGSDGKNFIMCMSGDNASAEALAFKREDHAYTICYFTGLPAEDFENTDKESPAVTFDTVMEKLREMGIRV